MGTKNFTAFFFLIHYGLFHFVYLAFLPVVILIETRGKAMNFEELQYIAMGGLVFFFNHLFFYIYNKSKDTKKLNIGSLMFYPYIRIIPMHIMIMLFVPLYFIISSFFSFSILFPFFLLKTGADLAMHVVEHEILRKDKELQI